MNRNLSTRAPEHPRTVLITGASSGIGEAFAAVFASEGFDLVITARREDRLRAVAARLREQYGRRVEVVVEDLAQPAAPARLCEAVSARGLRIDVLVNNAGYGVPGTFTASEWPRQAALLQVMVVAAAELAHRLLPSMIEQRYGRIINVASLAALVPAPAGHTLYAASKAFLVKFSEALASETRGSGVHVNALCPGFTMSEFHDVAGTRAKVRELPPWLWMDAPRVAREGYDAVMAGTPVHVTGRVNRTIAMLARHVPERLVVAIGRRAASKYRK
jgi:short-subunit dehydrogenase